MGKLEEEEWEPIKETLVENIRMHSTALVQLCKNPLFMKYHSCTARVKHVSPFDNIAEVGKN